MIRTGLGTEYWLLKYLLLLALGARYYVKHFTNIISFKSRNNSMRYMGTKRLSNGPILCFSKDEIYGRLTFVDFPRCQSGSQEQTGAMAQL